MHLIRECILPCISQNRQKQIFVHNKMKVNADFKKNNSEKKFFARFFVLCRKLKIIGFTSHHFILIFCSAHVVDWRCCGFTRSCDLFLDQMGRTRDPEQMPHKGLSMAQNQILLRQRFFYSFKEGSTDLRWVNFFYVIVHLPFIGYKYLPENIMYNIFPCILQCNFPGALSAYERALQVSVQREVRLLCLHEVGWSYVLLLHWQNAAEAFLQLRRESRWSKSFYCYLSSGMLSY